MEFTRNGKHRIKDFRLNESPIIMLNNLKTLGKKVRLGSRGFSIGGLLIPGMNFLIPYVKVRNFRLTSLSDAV
ncbi:MAG: hypothetical protein ABIS36_20840 [Chryseolinea sp.]